ncbi:NAD(P)/FAD-dependent oxidoreductase [Pedobacter sp. ASV28]|uniref:NAD(P)/FAD-dependent oxidoreductase n=1 Tax=Pedobacter sp. ASV28 TaxID=2795123 RepID=UPI0018EE0A20|nr:NAD(P)/FAD-dependent oxidoreductase [Pedobacter sp. ASV28]
MQFETEILIIGGGLAGLTAALHLQKSNFNITLIEKNTYPQHKVCGEYISNEVLPYLAWLEISFESLGPTSISNLQLTSLSGASITTKLSMGGFGLSRYAMDYFLYQQLLKRNITVIYDTVTDVQFNNDVFNVKTTSGQSFTAGQVLGAFGKRSSVDVKLKRDFIQKKSPYIAVKAHYHGNFQSDLVGLHNFSGGYCGVSRVENEKLNICYLADYQSFRRYKNILNYQQEVIYKNRFLKDILERSEMIFEMPLTIGQISFQSKEPILDHILMIGDTAGLIHPLCGNGMAMAMHSAKIASTLIVAFMRDKTCSRKEMEDNYAKLWNYNFRSRLRTGRILSSVLKNNTIQHIALNTLTKMPQLLGKIVNMTHGKPIPIL